MVFPPVCRGTLPGELTGGWGLGVVEASESDAPDTEADVNDREGLKARLPCGGCTGMIRTRPS